MHFSSYLTLQVTANMTFDYFKQTLIRRGESKRQALSNLPFAFKKYEIPNPFRDYRNLVNNNHQIL